jgi:hypothetical protein
MVRRDHLVEAKLVKQLPLIPVLPPPSSPTLLPLLKQESLFAPLLNSFFDSIDPERKSASIDECHGCLTVPEPLNSRSIFI